MGAQTSYNELLADEVDVQPFRVHLKMPHMGKHVCEVRASAELKLEDLEDASDEDNATSFLGAILMLKDIKYVRKSCRRSHSSSHSVCELALADASEATTERVPLPRVIGRRLDGSWLQPGIA